MIAHRIQAGLRPDPARVVARLFLPGEELHRAHSRASQVVGRVMSLAEDEVERLTAGLLRDFGGRHHNYQALLQRHPSIVSAHIEGARELTTARTLLLGATFTAEYATEAAALCNPSAVLGPDQGGLRAGQARVALSVRGIGEGHISSIGFCSAVGPMRVYVIGTLLLDLDDPTRVVGYSRTPLLSPGRDEQDGYVPNVVYSCGAFLHDGLVWIPYGVDDSRIGAAYAPLGEVLADMSSVS